MGARLIIILQNSHNFATDASRPAKIVNDINYIIRVFISNVKAKVFERNTIWGKRQFHPQTFCGKIAAKQVNPGGFEAADTSRCR